MSCIATSTFSASTSSTLPHHSIGATSSRDSPDQLLSDVLSAVPLKDKCRNCEEGATAYHKCLDCSELLCETCVKAHQRVRLTKDHRISRYPRAIRSNNSTSTTGSLGSLSQLSTSPCAVALTTCDTHKEPQGMFCQTCHLFVCGQCLTDHFGHQCMTMEELMDSVKAFHQRLSTETTNAIVTIGQALDSVQRMSDNVEMRSIQTATEVRRVMGRCISVLQEREVDLLKRIDHVRQLKGKMLMTQIENLRAAISKLMRTSDLLSECQDSPNACEVMVVNETAANELKQLRSVRPELVPCEDDAIVFVPPDGSFLRAISSAGNLTIGNAALMPPRRMARPPSVRDLPRFAGLPRDLPSRNRAIYGTQGTVVVKDFGPVPSQTFGIEGENDGELCRPWGVCCNHMGNIIVADRSNNRIQVFDGNGVFLYKFGSHGTAPGQFDRPAGLTVNPQGNIVVADKDNHRIQIFKMDGTFVHAFGEKGMRNGQFNYPWDVGCNAVGHIVVSDTRNHRVQLFTGEGVFLNKYGFEGCSAMWRHFDSPRGVCFSPKGFVVVTDFNNHRVVVIDQHFINAQFIGQEGTHIKQFLRPQGVVCDDEGNIIVADSRNNRLQVFERNGSFLWKVGQFGKGLGEFDRPSGICLTPEGRIVVVDFGNNRLQIF